MATSASSDEGAIRSLIQSSVAVMELPPPAADAVVAVMDATPAFFRLPSDEKAKARLGHAAGYRPYGIEYSNTPDHPDEMETFSITAASASRSMEFSSGPARDLNQCAGHAFRLLESVAEDLVVQLAARLTGRSPDDALHGGLHRWSTLQINYARPSETRSEFINDVHEDGHFLTLVHTTGGGLEVRRDYSEFERLTPKLNESVVMLGGVASLITDGRLAPLFHRVRAIREISERTSVLFFADLAPELCQPWIIGETNRSTDIGGFVRANPLRFGLQRYGSE